MMDFLKACFTDGPILFRIFSGIIVISIVIWIYWGTIITKQIQNQVHQEQEEVATQTLNNTEEIKQILLEKMNVLDNDTILKNKYPKGYCLFAIDHKKIIIPYNSQLELNYELDWNSACIVELNNEIVIIKLPDIKDTQYGNIVQGFTSEHLRKVGSKHTDMIIKNLKVVTEVIENSNESIIVVLGFLDRN